MSEDIAWIAVAAPNNRVAVVSVAEYFAVNPAHLETNVHTASVFTGDEGT